MNINTTRTKSNSTRINSDEKDSNENSKNLWKKSMRILVDIRHLNQQQQSGVGEYTQQLLRALFGIDKKNEYILLSSGLINSRYPSVASLLQDDRKTSQDNKVTFIHINQPNKLLNLRTLFLQHP